MLVVRLTHAGYQVVRERVEDAVPQVLPIVALDVERLAEHRGFVSADGMLRIEGIVHELLRLDVRSARLRQRLADSGLLFIDVLVAFLRHAASIATAADSNASAIPERVLGLASLWVGCSGLIDRGAIIRMERRPATAPGSRDRDLGA
jgi:hypothetical protein